MSDWRKIIGPLFLFGALTYGLLTIAILILLGQH